MRPFPYASRSRPSRKSEWASPINARALGNTFALKVSDTVFCHDIHHISPGTRGLLNDEDAGTLSDAGPDPHIMQFDPAFRQRCIKHI